MHSNIAIELLKSFSDEEMKRFNDYIKSSFFNKSNVLIKLFEILSKYHPDYTNPSLEKGKLYKKIYPGKPYNEQSLKNRMAELSDKIKEFLIYIRLEKNEITKKHYYIDELIERNKLKLAEQTTAGLINFMEKDKTFNVDYLLYNLQTLERKNWINFAKESIKEDFSDIKLEKGENLINYFFVYLFQLIYDTHTRSKTLSKKTEFNIIDEFMKSFDWESFLNKLKEVNYKHYNLLLIHYNMYLTLISDDEKHYYNLKKAIFEKFDNYSKNDRFNFIIFLLSTIYNDLALKNPGFYKESFELNKFGLENDIFVMDKVSYFPSQMFWSICNNAMNVNEIDWLEKFIKDYTPKLQPDEQNNMYNFSMSKVYFRKKEYEKSISCLSKMNYSKINDSFEKVHLRMNYFANYYELGMSDTLFSLIDSYKHYLSETKEISDSLKERLKKTVHYFSVIAKSKFNNKPLDYAEYKKISEEQIYLKNWIISKMEELLKK